MAEAAEITASHSVPSRVGAISEAEKGAKPTPGPWHANLHHTQDYAGRCHAFISQCGAAVPIAAVILGVEGTSHDEGRANTRLITEAGTVYHETGLTPKQLAEQRADMLAALIAAEKADTAHMNFDECEPEDAPESCSKCFPLADDARLMRRAAIAKATGAAAP